MSRHRIRRIATFSLVGTVVAVAAFLYLPSNLSDKGAAEGPALRDTAAVEVSSLSDDYSLDATLLFADAVVAYATTGPGPSTITELVKEGASVGPGDLLWRLGNEPTVVLVGEIPAYRDLSDGDEGADVMQLEENLVALGFDPDGTVEIDEEFTYATEKMVERWQEAIGAEMTGTASASSIVYLDGIRLVGDVAHAVGDQLGNDEAVMTLTTFDRELTFTVPSAMRNDIVVGQAISARLPDRTNVAAMITEIIGGDSGGVAVTATLDSQPNIEADQVPVTVTWSNELATDVLTVPATALVRTDDGRYHVEVRDPDGEERFVEVAVGTSSAGSVEITGDLTPGDRVIAP